MLEVGVAQGDLAPLLDLLHDADDLLRHILPAQVLRRNAKGQEIHDALVAHFLDVGLVVGPVVGVEQDMRAIEVLHLQAEFVHVAKAGRPAYAVIAPGPHPFLSRTQQRMSRLAVIQHVKQPEPADVLSVVLVVARVDKRRNATHRFCAAPGYEVLDVQVIGHRAALRIELVPAHRDQRRHPVRIVRKHLPRQAQKRPLLRR